MGTKLPDWPADAWALEEGRRFLLEKTRARTLIVPDGDADGLASGALALRALERLGRTELEVVLPGKGQHPQAPALRDRLRRADPWALVVVDAGSRGDPILPGVPTLIVDHHQPRGLPPDALVVSAFGHEPVAPSSLLSFVLFGMVADLADLDWLAALGTVADLGADAPFFGLKDVIRRVGAKHLTASISLVNAAGRSGGHDLRTALDVLLAAKSPADIALGRVEGVARLQAYREEVAHEVRRCAATRPSFAGEFALLRMRSSAKVHPLVARRWVERLSGYVVIAANFGYLPGKVNFAVRSAGEENLIEKLRALAPSLGGEFAYGHPKATGGSLPREDFLRLLESLGFSTEEMEAASP